MIPMEHSSKIPLSLGTTIEESTHGDDDGNDEVSPVQNDNPSFIIEDESAPYESRFPLEEVFPSFTLQKSLPVRGPKQNLFVTGDSFGEEHEAVLRSRAIMYKLVSEKRPILRNHLSLGRWEERERKVKIHLMKGRHWSSIGHYQHKHTYIYPEEALFLLDRGSLTLVGPDESSYEYSMEEAYRLLINHGHLSIETLQVYMYLKRLGYIVIRCDSSSLFSYKIYRPDSRFRKSSPGSPSFYLSIQSYSNNPLDLGQILEMFNETHGIPVRLALIDATMISFFTIHAPDTLPLVVFPEKGV